MNCQNCTCPDCEKDRQRADLKAHRHKVLNSWSWNASAFEAGRGLRRELEAGRGGDDRAWLADIRDFFGTRDAEDLIQHSGLNA